MLSTQILASGYPAGITPSKINYNEKKTRGEAYCKTKTKTYFAKPLLLELNLGARAQCSSGTTSPTSTGAALALFCPQAKRWLISESISHLPFICIIVTRRSCLLPWPHKAVLPLKLGTTGGGPPSGKAVTCTEILMAWFPRRHNSEQYFKPAVIIR